MTICNYGLLVKNRELMCLIKYIHFIAKKVNKTCTAPAVN